MARGSATAQNTASSSEENASNLFGPLSGTLSAEAITPGGMSPIDLAAADTAEQQSAGGGQSAAVGQGALLAGRTRNAGSADAAVGASTRAVGQQLSEGALQTRLKNAGMKMQQQQAGIGGLGNLYSENLGAVAPNVNANTEAENASWDWAKDLMGPMLGAAGGAASPGGAITKAFT
jgi:hypothetical protein